MRWIVSLLIFGGCAKSTMPGTEHPHDLSIAEDLGEDAGGGSDFSTEELVDGGRDLAFVPYRDGGRCAPRINEVQTSVAGDSHWEFVELYNPCNDFPLDGWSLVYRSASNAAPTDGNDSGTLFVFGAKTILRHGYLVYTGPSTSYTGPSDGMLLGLGLADDGAIGLRDPGAHLVDAVAYGAVVTGHAFIETMPAPKPPRVNAPGQSIARHPDGADDNDNATDFVAGSPTPGSQN